MTVPPESGDTQLRHVSQQQPIPIELTVRTPAPEIDEEGDPAPLFDYLQSPQGHEIVGRVLAIFEDVKKVAVNQATTQAKLERVFQLVIIVTVVTASTVLAWFGKFDATIGILFGTLVGYVFGKRANS